MTILEDMMRIAMEEAKQSLREGNHGFGAVIIKDNQIIAAAHDEEETAQDPTSHAELNAIRIASKSFGKNLHECSIVSTHEPCPMCASAMVWAGIKHVVYGYSIDNAVKQHRERIPLGSAEIFSRAGQEIEITTNVLFDECKLLYDEQVRSEIRKLRGITREGLERYNEETARKRLRWFQEHQASFDFVTDDPLKSAYVLLLCRFRITSNDAPVISESDNKLIFHSMNFCPTLEACKILELDTRYICKLYNEEATDRLVKKIDPSLRFARNYNQLRPYAEYCEEMIVKE
jgi:tRNA(adenine34) deaminase